MLEAIMVMDIAIHVVIEPVAIYTTELLMLQ